MHGRVLIADDNAAVRRTLRQLLERNCSCEVVDAENGQIAVSLALEHPPDVAVLDLAMPVMDGLTAAREISRALPETEILMYTMHLTPQLEREAKRFGVRRLFSKAQGAVLSSAVLEVLAAKYPPSAPAETTTLPQSEAPANTSPQPIAMASPAATPIVAAPDVPAPAITEPTSPLIAEIPKKSA